MVGQIDDDGGMVESREMRVETPIGDRRNELLPAAPKQEYALYCLCQSNNMYCREQGACLSASYVMCCCWLAPLCFLGPIAAPARRRPAAAAAASRKPQIVSFPAFYYLRNIYFDNSQPDRNDHTKVTAPNKWACWNDRLRALTKADVLSPRCCPP